MVGVRGLVVLLVAVLGFAATFFVSQTLKTEARQGWQLEATKTAESLSNNLLGWLEESYAPISGLAALAENSDVLSESEFLNAFDNLEARATAFFLEAAAIVEAIPDTEIGSWQIKYSTDPGGLLSNGTPLAETPGIHDAVRAAKARTGEIILNRPVAHADGTTVSPIALSTFTHAGEVVIIGLVDYRALIRGLKELRVPGGADVRITARFPGAGGPGPERQVVDSGVAAPLFSVPTRTVTAGAELIISWDFDAGFSGGPPTDLSTLALISGLAGTAFVTLLMFFLMHQKQTVTLRGAAATPRALAATAPSGAAAGWQAAASSRATPLPCRR